MVIKCFLLFFCLVANEVYSFNQEEYVSNIEQLMLNPFFVQEYQKWTSKLFSNPDYLYGKAPGAFPCSLESNKTRAGPSSIHDLHPKDVQCIAAIGDSITAGLGAQANTPIGLVTEWRGELISVSHSSTRFVFFKEFLGQWEEIFPMKVY